MMEERFAARELGRTEARTDAAGHLDLLSSTRELRRAAVDADLPAIHDQLAALRSHLLDHLHAEADGVARLPGATPEVVRSGQERILRLLDELLFAADDGATDCTCLLRSAEIEVALRRQAKLEAALLGRSPQRTEGRHQRASGDQGGGEDHDEQ